MIITEKVKNTKIESIFTKAHSLNSFKLLSAFNALYFLIESMRVQIFFKNYINYFLYQIYLSNYEKAAWGSQNGIKITLNRP